VGKTTRLLAVGRAEGDEQPVIALPRHGTTHLTAALGAERRVRALEKHAALG